MILGCLLIIVGVAVGSITINSTLIIDNVIDSHPEVIDKVGMRKRIIGLFMFISLLLSLGGVCLII